MEILIIGSGAWATALSQVLLSKKENNITIYGVNEFELEDLKIQKNTSFFEDYLLPYKYFEITNDIKILNNKKFDYIVYAAPSEFVEDVLDLINKEAKYPFILINAAKGFVLKTKELIFNLINKKNYPKIKDYACILGPGFAFELVQQQFTVLNVLSKDLNVAKQISNLFNNKKYFVCFPSTLVEECEIISNLKNPLAIVSGILNGLDISINVISAIISLGIQEILGLLKAMNLKEEAIKLYSGIGDIYLTCSSTKSRNYTFGNLIAKYEYANEACKHYNKTVEGKYSCLIANEIFEKYKIKTILFNTLNKVLKSEINAKQFIKIIKDKLLNN